MNKEKKIFWIIIGGLALIMISSLITNVLLIQKLPKTAYISTNKVFNDFGLKKELEKKFNEVKEERSRKLDSLKKKVKFRFEGVKNSSDQKNETVIRDMERLKNQYYKQEEKYKQNNNALKQKYHTQIWNQLNQYIKEFGEKQGFDYIYGVQGKGNIMFARKGNNITHKIIQYVNKKYNGEI